VTYCNFTEVTLSSFYKIAMNVILTYLP
jgi:hypothetical protein